MDYSQAKELVAGSIDGISEMSIIDYFKAGGITGCIVAFVEGPIDLFKTQLQTQIFKPQPLFNSFPSAVKHIVTNYGIRGVYQGSNPNIRRIDKSTTNIRRYLIVYFLLLFKVSVLQFFEIFRRSLVILGFMNYFVDFN